MLCRRFVGIIMTIAIVQGFIDPGVIKEQGTFTMAASESTEKIGEWNRDIFLATNRIGAGSAI